MQDIIQLLPDVVANQIAAGEVIQRPASALKELMENSIDAGGRLIRVVIREAGKSLIQVIDDGCGMSETDARMSFERYATSKIRKAEDLYSIHTMGFRGEALASIAAISHVELKTRRETDETGIQLSVEGGELVYHQPVAVNAGTSIAVKNLFFNVPARRNFLKSNASEMRHLIEEFQRIALSHSDIEFSLHHNDTEVFNLKPGNLRQRIISVFGNACNEKLVPVEEDTSLVSIRGFIGKPEFARKTRGEQYFFVNHRFIKDPYLHHAVSHAFEDLLPSGSFPAYFLFLDIEPSKIDINVHPTKTEIKFEDDKSLYAILRASVKRALGKYSIAPTLDFDQEQAFNLPFSKLTQVPVPPKIQINPSFNPFRPETEIRFPSRQMNQETRGSGFGQDLSILYKDHAALTVPDANTNVLNFSSPPPVEFPWYTNAPCFQIGDSYIAVTGQNKLYILDQQALSERVLYSKALEAISRQPMASQKLVFPKTIELSAVEFSVISEIMEELAAIGFELGEFGNNTCIIYGIPALISEDEIKQTLDCILEQFQNGSGLVMNVKEERFALAVSKRLSVKAGRKLQAEEMQNLVSWFFSSVQPEFSPSGKKVFISFNINELERKFS